MSENTNAGGGDICDFRPDLGAPTREPSIRELVRSFYGCHFADDASVALWYSDEYCAALSTQSTGSGGVAAEPSEAALHAAMDAFYPGEDWRTALGRALDTSLRDMRAALKAAQAVKGGGLAAEPATWATDDVRAALSALARFSDQVCRAGGFMYLRDDLKEMGESAREHDPEVGVFSNREYAAVCDALAYLVETVGPNGVSLAKALDAVTYAHLPVAAEPVAWAYEAALRYALEPWCSADGLSFTVGVKDLANLARRQLAAAPTPPAGGGETERLRRALLKIAELRGSEAGEPFDDALDIADAALAAEPSPASPAGDLNSLSVDQIEAAAAAYYDGMTGTAEQRWPHHEGWAGKSGAFKDKVRAHMARALAAAHSAPAAPREGPSEEEMAKIIADDGFGIPAEWMAVAAKILALLTPADRGETQAVGDGWSTDIDAGKREPEVDLFLSGEGIRPHRRPLHYWDQEQRGGGAWTECADRNVTDPRDRIAIPSRWVTHWRKPPAPPTSSPDQNRGEPDQGGANTEAAHDPRG